MNKKKGIIIGVVLFVLAVAVGYALFSDTLTINGTATAKGEFELTYLCDKDEGDGQGECSVSGNTITTTSTLSKPNESVTYAVTVTNTGTIPAVLKTVTSPNNKDISSPTFEDGDSGYLDTTTMLAAYYGVVVDFSSGTPIIGDAAVEDANIVIEPGDSISIAIVHYWFDSSVLDMEQPAIPAEGATINYNLTFGFEQKTN